MATAANNKRTPLRRATTSRGRVGSGRSARPAEADARATAPTLAVGIGGAIAALGILLARDYLFVLAEAPGTLTTLDLTLDETLTALDLGSGREKVVTAVAKSAARVAEVELESSLVDEPSKAPAGKKRDVAVAPAAAPSARTTSTAPPIARVAAARAPSRVAASVPRPATAPPATISADQQVALLGSGAVLSVAAAIAATQKKGGVKVGSEATGDDAAKAAIGTEVEVDGGAGVGEGKATTQQLSDAGRRAAALPAAGSRVALANLVKSADLNGRQGTVQGVQADGSVLVAVDGDTLRAFRAANLVADSGDAVEGSGGRAEEEGAQ